MKRNTTYEVRVYLSVVTLLTTIITSIGALRALFYNTKDIMKSFNRSKEVTTLKTNGDTKHEESSP